MINIIGKQCKPTSSFSSSLKVEKVFKKKVKKIEINQRESTINKWNDDRNKWGVRYNKILFINGLMVRIGVKGNINDRKMGVIN